jgi:hypothetical protein
MARLSDVSRRMVSTGVGAVWLLVAAGAAASAAGEPAAVLRLARSADGLDFRDAGLFATNAAAPALLRLSSGQLLAVFDRQPGSELCVCQSRDGGASWSAARPIRLKGAGERGSRVTHGALVQVSPRLVRLYFVTRDPGREPAADAGISIASAVTRNGLDWQLDPQVHVDAGSLADPRPIALKVGSLVHLFVSPGPAGRSSQGKGAMLHLISSDGRRFRPASETPPRVAAGSVIDLGRGGMRMYAWGDQGVISLTAVERRDWTPEAGTRLAGGSEPAVTTLADGSFLMIHSAASTKQSAGGTALVNNGEPQDGSGAVEPAAQAGAATPGTEGWEPFAPDGATAAADAMADAAETASAEAVLPPVADLIAPPPDPQNEVDYYEWLQQRSPLPAEGNAYDVYAQIMHTPEDAGKPKAGWPDTLEDMFNNDNNIAPFPWNPAQYPKWEASNQNVRNLLDTFRQASLLEQYVDPMKFSAEQIANAPNGRPLLMEALLPALADHRKLVRATLADAWRAENGQVAPDRMLTDVETVLRASSHYQQGPTLIHRLVAAAEQNTAEATARQALLNVPFTPEQIEAGLRMLQQYDRGPTDPAGFIPGEAAMTMQITQELLKPRPPSIDDITSLFGFELPSSNSGSSKPDPLAEFRKFRPAEAQAAAEAFRQYFPRLAEQFRAGYPQVTERDVRTLTEQYAKTNRMTQAFVPSLNRAYLINTRNEAGRRGTQLTWAVNLFHARNGRWPTSLDELPADGSKMRTDPFTGHDFVYRLTPTGPTIYSTSENGADDGGTHSSKWGDEESVKKAGGSDDYVFWPPQ